MSSGCYFSIYQHIFSIFNINLAAWAATQSPCVGHVGSMSSTHFWVGCVNLMGWRERRICFWFSQGREWKKIVEKKGKVGEVGAWDEFKVKEGIPEMDVVVEGSRGMILWCQRANWEPMLDGWICLLQVPKSHAASFLQPTPLGFQACSEVLAMSCKSSCVCDTGKEWKRMQALCSSRSWDVAKFCKNCRGRGFSCLNHGGCVVLGCVALIFLLTAVCSTQSHCRIRAKEMIKTCEKG